MLHAYFSTPIVLCVRLPRLTIQTSSGLPESCSKNGDVPKSPLQSIGSIGAVGRHKLFDIELRSARVPSALVHGRVCRWRLRVLILKGESPAWAGAEVVGNQYLSSGPFDGQMKRFNQLAARGGGQRSKQNRPLKDELHDRNQNRQSRRLSGGKR